MYYIDGNQTVARCIYIHSGQYIIRVYKVHIDLRKSLSSSSSSSWILHAGLGRLGEEVVGWWEYEILIYIYSIDLDFVFFSFLCAEQ